ncbi:MAG: hypothetical protein ACYC77_09560 [Coriobacteriia bacterium]
MTTHVGTASHRRAVHTEVRAPLETVVSRIVWYVAGAIDVFLAIRFALLLFGANAVAGFVKLIYSVSDVFMAPFVAVFPTAQVEGSVFEWSALLAIAIYALAAWGITELIRAVVPRDRSETVEEVKSEQDVGAR